MHLQCLMLPVTCHLSCMTCDRSASLAHVNTLLREQLDQATSANQSLTADIHKLTQDWQRAREELEAKEREWREEEHVR
jgi:rootletin